ncbi:Asp23/Gls24 family envelope stress response protein [Geodermatophilus nigrescens]
MSGAGSTAATGREATTGPAPDSGTGGDRGELTIADKVIERVAGHAATQVPGASAAPRRLLGITVGDARPDGEAAVQARVDGTIATVSATIAVEWPHSVRDVTHRLRERIRADVRELTGVGVAHVDIDVVAMPVPAPARRVR